MVIRVLALLVIAAVAGAAGLLVVSTAFATQHPERSFSPASVGPGTDREVVVTITRVGAAGGFAQVVETLPEGFTFKVGSEDVADVPAIEGSGVSAEAEAHADGVRQVVTLTVLAADSIRYTVSVADDAAEGQHEFTGFKKPIVGADVTIDATSIMVTASPVMATATPVPSPTTPTQGMGPSRSFSPAVLPAGTNREVVVTVSGIDALGGFAQVIETLPAGFTFKTGSAEVADASPHPRSGASGSVLGQVLTIEVLAADSIRYTVMVDDSVAAGTQYDFSGVVKKLSGETPIGGTGTEPMPSTLSRDFDPERLSTGTGRELMVTVSGIGAANGFAQLTETLPAGFTFNDGSAEVADAAPHAKSGVLATVSGQVVMIEVVAADSVRYTVSVADDVGPGSYLFSGVVKTVTSEEQIETTVISPTATPTPTVTPTPVPTDPPRRRGGGGGGGGGGYAPVLVTATPTPAPTRAPVATIAPTPTMIIVPTVPPATATPVLTPEPTATPRPAATPRPTAVVVVPTVEPTAMPEPTATPMPTATSVPPTEVPPTEVPPTAVPPTEVPPTATPAPTVAPPVTPTEPTGMPTWLIVLIIVVIVGAVIAGLGYYLMRMRR